MPCDSPEYSNAHMFGREYGDACDLASELALHQNQYKWREVSP